jgi:GNAT superfamily N-acetyltransferase/predicted nucleic acid-binding protein
MSEIITVERLALPSLHLERVMALHRVNSRTLGFFPSGAFDEHAKLRQILVALENGKLLGYLLFRIARGRATIVHLCVMVEARGRGIARRLVDHLKQETHQLQGIGLYCRRDYDINHIWSKYGFEAVHAKMGRGKDGAELTFWWFNHGHKDLLSRMSEPDPTRQQVVIDANVFYDLHARNTPESEDSKALLADWVQASIELVITKELRNEIAKAPNEEQRQASRSDATRYVVLPTDDAAFQQFCTELKPRFPASVTLRDEADLRQIAYTIAGEVPFLVTRDQTLIQRSEPLYRSHGLKVLHPAELINHLDSIEREADYRPARIEGSRLKNSLLKAEALEGVVTAFKFPEERTNEFSKALLRCLSQPKNIEIQLITDYQNSPVLLGAIDRQWSQRTDVPIFRRAKHPLATTMQRNFLRACLDSAAADGRSIVTVGKNGRSEQDIGILIEFGFVLCGDIWTKLTVKSVGDINELKTNIMNLTVGQDFAATINDAQACLDTSAVNLDVADACEIQRRFWPAKLVGVEVPTFIVAIRPKWAQHFFDADLGAQLLFGLREDLHLGVEGVYYRSAENNNLAAPGRILWYVSKGDGIGSMCIKAYSQLEEVIIGKPKDLFRRFQRLGIYEWNDVYAVANNDTDRDIVAFRFRMTERFKTPVDMKFLESIDIRGPFMSPRKITDTQFACIYSKGTTLT